MGEAGQRRLGGAIDAHPHSRHPTGIGGDIDDGAPAPSLKPGGQGPHQVERSEGVDGEGALQEGVIHLIEPAGRQYASDIDQHIGPQPLVEQLFAAAGHGLAVTHIDHHPLDIAGQRLGQLQIERHHAGPRLGKGARHRMANSLRRAGHPDGSALPLAHGVHSGSLTCTSLA